MIIDDEYTANMNTAYFAEEQEMKEGIHPSQIIEKVTKTLVTTGLDFCKITFMNYLEDSKVEVSVDDNVFGIFDYKNDKFI